MKKYFVKSIDNSLFLCSWDIHVGDEILVDGFPHIKPTKVVNIEITNPDHSVHITVYNCENGDWYELNEIFKVIGEISPDALSYVKEGQEFDEDELEAYFYCIKHPDESIYGYTIEQIMLFNKHVPKSQKYKVFVEIKGPCGYFH